MRVLIVGANGFIGRLITDYVTENQPDIELIRLLRGSCEPSGYHDVCVDLGCVDSLREAISASEPSVVINAAGLINGSARELFLANAVLPSALADVLSRGTKSVRLIQIGSAAEYGLPREGAPFQENDCCRPVSLYGISKLAGAHAVLACRASGALSVTHIRLFNIIAEVNSPNQVLGAFADRVKAFAGNFCGQPLTMGNLGAVRDFIAAQDFLEAISCLINGAPAPEILNVASGIGQNVRAVLNGINDALPVPFAIEESDFRSAANASNAPILGDSTQLTELLGRPVSPIEPLFRTIANRLVDQTAHGF
jgi:NDP-hexose 4-ketoreductase